MDKEGNFYGTGSSHERPNGYICELNKTESGYTTIDLYDFTSVAPGHLFGDASYPISVTFHTEGNLWGGCGKRRILSTDPRRKLLRCAL